MSFQNHLHETATRPFIEVCSTRHPLAKRLESLIAKPLFNADGVLYYVRFKADKQVVTYQADTGSIMVHNVSFDEFHHQWTDGTLEASELAFVRDTDKCIGNAIWREVIGTLM